MPFSLNRKIIFGSIFLGFLAFFLLVPLETISAWVFDLGMKQLDALDFVDKHILPLIFDLAKYLIFSQVFLLISAALLEWVIDLPIILTGNPLVTAGWGVILGITNLFFILFLVFIALCHILGIEIGKAFSTTKALVRLIIIALLVNFSLVFVGMLTDIAQVAFMAIRGIFIPYGLINTAIQPLMDNITSIALSFSAMLTIYLVAALLPYASVVAAAAIFTMAITEAITGGFSLAILLTIFGFLMGAMFMLYFIFFLFRIVIIWLLAIISPLALASWIFPSTEHFFKHWFSALKEWLFLGIAGIFLMGLGLNFFANLDAILDAGRAIEFGGVEIFPAFTFNYLFLIVWLIVSFYFMKKFLVPKVMVQAIASIKKMAGTKMAILGAKKIMGGRIGGIGGGKGKKGEKTEGSGAGEEIKPTFISRAMDSVGEKLEDRSIKLQKKGKQQEGLKEKITGMKARLASRAGESLKRMADEGRPKSLAEAEAKINKAKKGIEGNLGKQTIYDEELKRNRQEKQEEVVKRIAAKEFAGYNQEERIAAIRHFAEKGQLENFSKNIDRSTIKETVNQARGTSYAQVLNQASPESFNYPASLGKGIKSITSQNAHKIGIESLKKPGIVSQLSTAHLADIQKKGDTRKAIAITKTMPKIEEKIKRKKSERTRLVNKVEESKLKIAGKEGELTVIGKQDERSLLNELEEKQTRLNKEINGLEEKHNKRKAYMANSPAWQATKLIAKRESKMENKKKEEKEERRRQEAKKRSKEEEKLKNWL